MTPDAPELPPHLRPFVLPYEPVKPTRSGDLDLYLPLATPAPAVLMVHGGPVPPERPVRPPQWPAYRGYGALLARAGVLGAMVEHGFVDDEALPRAREDVRSALAALRADPRVDAGRIGLWFFSAGGLLMGSFLEPVPDGVVAVAGTYTAMADPDLEVPHLVQAADVVPRTSVPLLLVLPEHDFEWIAPTTEELLSRCRAAGRDVDVVHVVGAHHGFETVDDSDEARAAIRASIAWWLGALG